MAESGARGGGGRASRAASACCCSAAACSAGCGAGGGGRGATAAGGWQRLGPHFKRQLSGDSGPHPIPQQGAPLAPAAAPAQPAQRVTSCRRASGRQVIVCADSCVCLKFKGAVILEKGKKHHTREAHVWAQQERCREGRSRTLRPGTCCRLIFASGGRAAPRTVPAGCRRPCRAGAPAPPAAVPAASKGRRGGRSLKAGVPATKQPIAATRPGRLGQRRRRSLLRLAPGVICRVTLRRTFSASISCRISSRVGLSRFLKRGAPKRMHGWVGSQNVGPPSKRSWQQLAVARRQRRAWAEAGLAAAGAGAKELQQQAALEAKRLLDRRELLKRKVEQQQPACREE